MNNALQRQYGKHVSLRELQLHISVNTRYSQIVLHGQNLSEIPFHL